MNFPNKILLKSELKTGIVGGVRLSSFLGWCIRKVTGAPLNHWFMICNDGGKLYVFESTITRKGLKFKSGIHRTPINDWLPGKKIGLYRPLKAPYDIEMEKRMIGLFNKRAKYGIGSLIFWHLIYKFTGGYYGPRSSRQMVCTEFCARALAPFIFEDSEKTSPAHFVEKIAEGKLVNIYWGKVTEVL